MAVRGGGTRTVGVLRSSWGGNWNWNYTEPAQAEGGDETVFWLQFLWVQMGLPEAPLR